MNRKFILTIMLPVIVLIIVLGMRNPCLSSNHGPRPRPRAVIENVLSAAEQINHQHDLIAVIHCCLLSIQEFQTLPSTRSEETPTLNYTPASSLPPRAPPACTIILS